ncbi:heavy metal translocating P-type ATPase [Candidatus Albibeggiatoa sp. nov. NOAA]|uniref:heavy metal translocating P-type ATPase n=1 Tax=Candidatus Albibeggiatoa sp. nov. NOAA TaxID=3162724 RepID=UPI0032F3807B|nr:heavy metal translocating P-type ATPase [Thiotrichaceae bacterium]
MIIEALALSGILFAGYKEYEKDVAKDTAQAPAQSPTDEAKQEVKASEQAEQPESNEPNTASTSRLKRLFQGADDQNQEAIEARKSFERENGRGIMASSAALGLATAGVFVPPVALASIPFLAYTGHKVYKNAIKQIQQGRISVDVLVAITLTGCLLGGYFIAASIAMLMLRFSERLVARVTQDSKQSLVEAFSQHPNEVWVMKDGIEVKTPFEELQVGDIVVAHAGEMIPADGIVTEGLATIDQHILTGEAKPVDKEVGDTVFGSTVVLSGKVHVKVEKAGEEATVSKIINVLNDTIDFKSTTQLRADSLSKHLVKPVLLAGGVALPLVGFSGALAVINSHPKNKMMVLAPISILNYLNIATDHGILIKDGRSLELLNKVDTIVFDKTGTLTEEQPHVGNVYICNEFSEDEVLMYAAAAEYKQNHPLALAIIEEAESRNIELPSTEDSEYKLGFGLVVHVNGKTVHVGSDRFMNVESIAIPQHIQDKQKQCHEHGYSIVMIAIDRQLVGGIELVPTVRPEACQIIEQLKERGNITTSYIISGDNEAPTKKLAEDLGIDFYFAETLPEHKAELIEKLQDEGRFVCYVGDGINDSIALKKAQVSISLSGASTVATDTAQIILMDSGLTHLPYLFELAEEFNKNMNTSFAFMVVPAILSVSGAFLLGFGVAQSILLNVAGLSLGIGNAMRPYVTRKIEKHLAEQNYFKPKVSESDDVEDAEILGEVKAKA